MPPTFHVVNDRHRKKRAMIALPFMLNVLVATIPGIMRLPTVRLAMLAGAVFTLATSAAWLPARRAARIDPMVALRTE